MIKKIKAFFKTLREEQAKQVFRPMYRLVEITQTESEDYTITIQLVNKNVVFQTRPEDVLANDDLVDQFSPRDVRTLTYLGYLSLNNPKYKILAQRLSENSDKVLFAIRKKGDKKVLIKTADEIIKEKEILNNLGADDSHKVGYTVGTENVLSDKKQMDELRKEKLASLEQQADKNK